MHESLDIEFAGNVDLLALLEEAKANNTLPKSYFTHPVVLEAPANIPTYPIAIYLDGISFSRTDSVLGIWAYCLLTQKRHCLIPLRKSELCRCGCRKWCSLWPAWQMMLWSSVCMQTGVFPTARHDGSPWAASDEERARKAGDSLTWRGAIVYIKGDWSEFANSLGFSPWNHTFDPCMLCFASQATLFRTTGLGPLSFPHRLREWPQYDDSCKVCEVVRVVTEEDRRVLLGSMQYDKRPKGGHGRCLRMDVLGLNQHDRLEPSLSLPDVGSLETVQCPITVTFWRTSEQCGALHRNPFFLLLQELLLRTQSVSIGSIISASESSRTFSGQQSTR